MHPLETFQILSNWLPEKRLNKFVLLETNGNFTDNIKYTEA